MKYAPPEGSRTDAGRIADALERIATSIERGDIGMTNQEAVPPSDEIREQEAADVMGLLMKSLSHPPVEGSWEPPTLSRQDVVTLVKYVARLRDARRA